MRSEWVSEGEIYWRHWNVMALWRRQAEIFRSGRGGSGGGNGGGGRGGKRGRALSVPRKPAAATADRMGMHRTQRAHSAVQYVTRNSPRGVALLFYKWSTCKGALPHTFRVNA